MKESKLIPRHQLRLLAEVVVYKLYEAHLDDAKPDRHSLAGVHKMFGTPVSKRLIESCLAYLRTEHGEKTVLRSGTADSYLYNISSSGIIFAEKELRKNGSLIHYFSLHGDDRLEDVAGFEAIYHFGEDSDDEQVDASVWMAIDLDRNSSQFKRLVQSIDITIEVARTDNDLGANYPHQKFEILRNLNAGKDILESGTVNKRAVLANVLAPIKWILSTFAKGALNTAATETAQELIAFLKHFFNPATPSAPAASTYNPPSARCARSSAALGR